MAEERKTVTPLLKALIEKREMLVSIMYDDPWYKELCAVNYLIEREFINHNDQDDNGLGKVYADIVGHAATGNYMPAPDTSGGEDFARDLVDERMMPEMPAEDY